MTIGVTAIGAAALGRPRAGDARAGEGVHAAARQGQRGEGHPETAA